MNNNKDHPKLELPNARKIRRSCNRELSRTIKRMKLWVSPEQVAAAEKLYYQKVIANLIWVAENGSNRKKLADWWDEAVAPEIAPLWGVEQSKLSAAFRARFGG
ncbi:MAG: dehydrogenase [Paenibacillaceae bacterium]